MTQLRLAKADPLLPAAPLGAQTSAVVSDAEAAQHVGQHVTVEGTVVAVFTSKNGNTFLNFGAGYPNQTFTGWIPKSSALAGDDPQYVPPMLQVRLAEKS